MNLKEDQEKTVFFSREVLIALRKIIQAIDLHSRNLSKKYGLTGPQLVILQEIASKSQISVTELGRAISLSQGTVTDILSRLEKKGLIFKKKSENDKRRIELYITDDCERLLEQAPPPLQETFLEQFDAISDWEQMMILSSLQRLVEMMEAKKIDASPILASGPITNVQ